MAENSGISWTDHTFNPWLGCTNIGPGCDHCYAEKLVTTRLGVGWGPGAPRRRTKPGNWAKVRAWHNGAEVFKAEHGRYPRVFAASLADIFDNEIDLEWRADFWALVKSTPKLQWLIVTKRIGNVKKMLPPDWGDGYPNVVLIITVVNQEEADRDVCKLLATPAAKRGLSIEPMLGPIDLECLRCAVDLGEGMPWLNALAGFVHAGQEDTNSCPRVDWVITGGESAQLKGKRDLVQLEAGWVRDIDMQCVRWKVPHHFKQWGHTIPIGQIAPGWNHDVLAQPGAERVAWREDNHAGTDMGRQLDGTERNGFPPQ